ncbi:MAG: LysM peptidoglycan-binding domain-containing protein [Chloroflexi bacterium]|nr:MAG: LysM domain-containing protein [Chloroflexi bacterium OLB13]MBC6957035.1 LysM peptidoglycan-binding domain-containing protein [Chloroflexota bacterium]MBV6435576.1 Autolysin [Anaerolineae bacterium]MDL1914578.1 LysM peptidoglycan-binding domain-containing protein [Anaerolineae bacterium CFX4]OQY83088.1 MAG: hypothetical protein B6D42_08320 [Anaerolineae bacterium UTCFX5]
MNRRRALTLCIVLILTLGLVSVASAQQTYVVQPGDTLAKIAARFQTSVGAIAAANGIANVNTIYYGQSLVIPAPGTESSPPPASGTSIYYVVRPGDTLSEIAVKYNSTVDAIKSANGLSTSVIYPNQGLRVPVFESAPAPWYPPVGAQYYYVQPGDTLFRIGARFGVNIYRIAEANRLLNLNLIYAGVPLYIPR